LAAAVVVFVVVVRGLLAELRRRRSTGRGGANCCLPILIMGRNGAALFPPLAADAVVEEGKVEG
jgi:hypothetical protein